MKFKVLFYDGKPEYLLQIERGEENDDDATQTPEWIVRECGTNHPYLHWDDTFSWKHGPDRLPGNFYDQNWMDSARVQSKVPTIMSCEANSLEELIEMMPESVRPHLVKLI